MDPEPDPGRCPLRGLLLLALIGCPGGLAGVQVSVPARVEVMLGAPVTIPCTHSVTGAPGAPLLEWFITERDGQRRRVAYSQGGRGEADQGTEFSTRLSLAPDLSLLLPKAELSDERPFSCQVTAGAAGSAEGAAQLRVFEPPEAPELATNPGILSVTEPSVSEIATCSSRNANPAPAISWLKDGTPLRVPSERNDDMYAVSRTVKEASGLQSVSSTLYLRPSKADKDARFHCLVRYPLPWGRVGNATSEPFSLTLHYFTENVEFALESPLVIREGDDVQLRCRGDGQPEPEYVFYRVQSPQDVELAAKPDGVLTLPSVSRADSGTYRCQVLDFDSPAEVQLEKEVIVHVHYLDPPTLQPGRRVTVPLGGDVTVTCSARGSQPPRLAWRKGQERVGQGSSLPLRAASYGAGGTYSCQASLPGVPGLQREQSLQVTVEGKPEMEARPSRLPPLAEGQRVQLSCSAVGHPEPQISWSLPGATAVASGAGGRVRSELAVEATAALARAGLWCRARNRFGEATQHFTLQIEPPAATPSSPPTGGGSEPQAGGSAAVVAVVVCVLLLLLIVASVYCLRRRGHLACGAGEKRSLTPQEGGAPAAAVEMKTDKRTEETVLLSASGAGGERGAGEC